MEPEENKPQTLFRIPVTVFSDFGTASTASTASTAATASTASTAATASTASTAATASSFSAAPFSIKIYKKFYSLGLLPRF